jgi:hypothetical protein
VTDPNPHDRLGQFEAELSGLRPRSLPAELVQNIESRLTPIVSRRWADRLLILAMSSGAVAACLIVGLLFGSGQPALPAAYPTNLSAAGSGGSGGAGIGDFSQVFAKADIRWMDSLE